MDHVRAKVPCAGPRPRPHRAGAIARTGHRPQELRACLACVGLAASGIGGRRSRESSHVPSLCWIAVKVHGVLGWWLGATSRCQDARKNYGQSTTRGRGPMLPAIHLQKLKPGSTCIPHDPPPSTSNVNPPSCRRLDPRSLSNRASDQLPAVRFHWFSTVNHYDSRLRFAIRHRWRG